MSAWLAFLIGFYAGMFATVFVLSICMAASDRVRSRPPETYHPPRKGFDYD